MYISYCKSHYHSGTADLRHMWLVLVRLTPAFLSTPWLAGGWPATDTQLGWLFLPHCSSLLASRPAGASSHDSSGRAAKSNKRKPFMCRYFSSLFLWHSGYWPIAQGKSLVNQGSLQRCCCVCSLEYLPFLILAWRFSLLCYQVSHTFDISFKNILSST